LLRRKGFGEEKARGNPFIPNFPKLKFLKRKPHPLTEVESAAFGWGAVNVVSRPS
jgi:hypothetical protein